MTNQPRDPEIEAATRRVVGIAALRQLRIRVDQELALESSKARWSRRIGITASVAVICGITWLLFVMLR